MMTPKFRVILEQAISEGVARGYRRAFKHVENPSENTICETIEEQVMSSLYDYFDFDKDNSN
jgi:hypothetical protein